MARLIHEAKENWSELALEEQRELGLIRATLTRLEREFQEELDEVEGVQEAASSFVKPAERVTARYRYQGGPHSVFNNEGIDYFDGSNAVVDLTMRARIANHLGLFAQPRFIYRQNREGETDVKGNEVDEANFDLWKYYAKLDIKNFEIQAGADSLWWNPAYHGSLIMSNNAEPFVMLKFSNPLPTVLPWIFRYLGLVKFNFIYTELDSNRLNPVPCGEQFENDHNDPSLGALHLDFKPFPWLELGFNTLSIYGGEGREDLSFWDQVQIIFGNQNLSGEQSSNTQVSLFFLFRWYHVAALLPVAETLTFYGEWGAEDSGFLPDNRAYQLGLLFGDFLKWQGRLQFRLEYTNTTPNADDDKSTWYTHSEYPSTYEGRIFGHHVGSDADDFLARLSILLNPQLELGFQADYERRGKSLEIFESVLQGQIDAHYRLNDNISFLGHFGWEHAEDVDCVEGASDDRTYFSFLARYYF